MSDGLPTRRGSEPTTARLNWKREEDPEATARKRHAYGLLIAGALAATEDRPQIDRSLELGRVCPATSKADRDLWTQEIERRLRLSALHSSEMESHGQ